MTSEEGQEENSADVILGKIDQALRGNDGTHIKNWPLRFVGNHPNGIEVALHYLVAPKIPNFNIRELNSSLRRLVPEIKHDFYHRGEVRKKDNLWQVGAIHYKAGYIGRTHVDERHALKDCGIWTKRGFHTGKPLQAKSENDVFGHVWVYMYPDLRTLEYAFRRTVGSGPTHLPLPVVRRFEGGGK